MIMQLFKTFFKIGAFTFGGGYAMLPIIQRELVNNKKYITNEEFMDAIAVAQASPGPVSVNTSIYVGYKIKGLKGALACALGAVLPSFFIILVIAMFLFKFRSNSVIEKIFMGIRPAVVALILSAVYTMWSKSRKTYIKLFTSIVTVLLIVFLGISPVLIVIAGAIISVIYHRFYHIDIEKEH
ncbi:MAG: chromate transporter [Clostridia bacterium]|nr:chromate transporter [Clostridia bacterium]